MILVNRGPRVVSYPKGSQFCTGAGMGGTWAAAPGRASVVLGRIYIAFWLCMHACMHGWMDGWMYVCMGGNPNNNGT